MLIKLQLCNNAKHLKSQEKQVNLSLKEKLNLKLKIFKKVKMMKILMRAVIKLK